MDGGGRAVGQVTSGGFSPSLGAPVAMGYVAAEAATVGTPLALDLRGRAVAAAVADLPFVPHRYQKG